jgi:hypothetical protein
MNTLLRAIQAAAIICVALGVGGAAYGAKITAPGLHVKASNADAYWPTDPVLCDLVLEGDLEEGDAQSIEQSFQTIVGSMNSFSFFLCLRSSGGDLREAIKIARFVLGTQRPSIATVVEDGQICASACAIIFLAGNAPARVGAFPQRFLHPRGRLLFHSSRLDLSKFTDKELLDFLTQQSADPRGLKGKIVDLYKDGLQDVQSVISTFQKFIYQREELGDRWVRPSLFLEMFSQSPDEWICIDTVDAVGRWNIQVYGYQSAKQQQKQNYANLCTSAYHWRADRFAAGSDDLELTGDLSAPASTKRLAGRNKSNTAFDRRFTLPFQATFSPLTCVVELDDKPLNSETTINVFLTKDVDSYSGGIQNLAPLGFSPADSLLRDLPGVRPGPAAVVRQQPSVKFSEYSNSVMNGCSYKRIHDAELDACEAACAADIACKSYSLNKIGRVCELKHTMTALRFDPFWTSGTPTASSQPGRSSRAHAMAPWQRKSAAGKDLKIVGRLIDEGKAEGEEACSKRCMSDPRCVASELGNPTNVCRRFSEVNGVHEKAEDEEFAETKLKKQE